MENQLWLWVACTQQVRYLSQEITLSFSSYHSFIKSKVTLQWMFIKFSLGLNRKTYQCVVLSLPKVTESPGLRDFFSTRLSTWTVVSLRWDVSSSHSSWSLGAWGDENIKSAHEKDSSASSSMFNLVLWVSRTGSLKAVHCMLPTHILGLSFLHENSVFSRL